MREKFIDTSMDKMGITLLAALGEELDCERVGDPMLAERGLWVQLMNEKKLGAG